MIRKIIYEDEAKMKIAEGIQKLCNVLCCDGSVLVNGNFSLSAVEIAKSIEGKNLWVNQGIRLAAEAIGEINERTGCGSREAAEMMTTMLNDCKKDFASGKNPIFLARELKEASRRLEKEVIKSANVEEKPEKELLNEITKDEKTSELIMRASSYGKPIVKESVYIETTLEICEGMKIEQSALVGEEALIHEVYVMITDRILSRFEEILPLLEKMGEANLLIVAEDLTGEAKALLDTNVKQGRLHVWAMKAPGYGQRKRDLLEDLAVLSGTRVIHEYYPGSALPEQLDELGKAEKVQITKQYAIVSSYENEEQKRKIRERIEYIEEKLTNPAINYYDQQKYRERIAWLSGTSPILYAGGETIPEAKYRKRILEYAVAYAQSVQDYGIVTKDSLENIWTNKESESAQAETFAVWKMLENSVKQSFLHPSMGALLLSLCIRKVSGLLCMWLTTGACMVSTGYDKEDIELMKSGVDVAQLRG